MTLPNPFDFLGDNAGNSGSVNGATESATALLEPPPTAAAEVAQAPAANVATKTRSARAARKPLYLDLETIPDESRRNLFDLPSLPEIVQPAPETADADMMPAEQWVTQDVAAARQSLNGKNPSLEWIAAARAAETAKEKGGSRKGIYELLDKLIEAKNIAATSAAARQQAEEDQRKTMSVTPEFCQIVAMGWAVGDDPAMSMVVGQPVAEATPDEVAAGTARLVTERMIVERFWFLAAIHGPIVGYNVSGFDLPVLFIRSIILDVDSSKKIDRNDWGADVNDVNDLMKKRFPFGPAKKLKHLAALLGISIPAEGVDGSQVAALAKSDPIKLGEYVRSDVEITRALAKKFEGRFC